MKQALVISGRIPREISALAKDYYAYHGESHVKVMRVWYTVYSGGKSSFPSWVLVHLTDRSGRACSTICSVDVDSNGDRYFSEFLASSQEMEERLLTDWQRIVDEV